MKERVYTITQKCIGHFMLEPSIVWVAETYYGKEVAWDKLKAECIKQARAKGYIVPKSAL